MIFKVTKKYFLLLLTSSLLAINTFTQSLEDKSLKEFNSGEINEFLSNGQGKSQGLKIHFKYPKSWKSIDGEHPHVIKKFSQSDNYAIAIILVNKQKEEFSQSEINEILTLEGLKSMIPSSGTFISANSNLKIEGLKAGSIEFFNSGQRIDREFHSFNLFYVFIYDQYLISIQFMVINKIGESKQSLNERYKKIGPLFHLMFNSIIIDNIWEN